VGSRLAVALVIMCGAVTAQYRGGAGAGLGPGRLTGVPTGASRLGTFPSWGGSGGARFHPGWRPAPGFGRWPFYWPLTPGFTGPACGPVVFPADLYPLFNSGCDTGYYPPPTQPSSVIVVSPPPSYPPAAPAPIGNEQASDIGADSAPTGLVPARETPGRESVANDHGASLGDNSGSHFYEAPPRVPVTLHEYSAFIVLKTGGMYSVSKHWVKGKIFYFITSHGETFQMPISLLDRVYPAVASR
jgi:hypothetical protein